jgi:predicted kinase
MLETDTSTNCPVRRAVRRVLLAEYSIAIESRTWAGSAFMIPMELSGCVIVSGMPGAGKSTVCEMAARLLRRAALVKGDDVNVMIRTGAVWFAGEPRDEAARQVELCKRNMCALANNFVDYGFSVFMDTVVQDRATLDQLLALLSPRPARLVILAPGVDICQQRNAARHSFEQFAFDGYEQLDAAMRRDLSDDAWWFDTAALSPEETAEALVREAAERVRPLRHG